MSIDTYSELQTAVSNWLERDDLSSRIPEFIELAEANIRRDVRIAEMLTRSSLTVNARQISKPTGYLEALNIRLLTDPVTVLTNVNLNEMTRLRKSTTGKPLYFTVHTEIEFDRSPDQSYSGEIVFFKAIDPLATTSTNNLLTNAPDIYLYGSLLAAEPFLMNDERVVLWKTLYQQAVDNINQRTIQSRHPGPQYSRVIGAGP